jgi:H+/Cl- antiporter ClcA
MVNIRRNIGLVWMYGKWIILAGGLYNLVCAAFLAGAFSYVGLLDAFILKMLFTAVTLGGGFKGGEIVPSFFIGATFGCVFGHVAELSPSLCAAVGMIALFCGVTNCPITSLLICLEIFGMDGMPYFLLSVALSYMMSGYYGLYSSQKIVYSKYRSNYINKDTE